jgi:uncharacterized membrane protein
MMYSGSLPLPPPPVLSAYDEAFPGLVEKLISWTEEQRNHRFKLERAHAERSETRLDRGQWIAGIVAIGGLVLASIVGVVGSSSAATVIAIVAVGGPTAAIAIASRQRQDTSAPKASSDAAKRGRQAGTQVAPKNSA